MTTWFSVQIHFFGFLLGWKLEECLVRKISALTKVSISKFYVISILHLIFISSSEDLLGFLEFNDFE